MGGTTRGNLLVIEPMGASGELLLRSVRRRGWRAVVATTPEVHRAHLGAVEDLIDDLVFVDLSEPDRAVVELVKSSDDHGYDGVVVSWEFLTDVAARVAHELGLRGPSVGLAPARRNKLAMHRAWHRAGCSTPRLQAVIDPEDRRLDAIGPALTMPAVVKPAENSASFGVTVVEGTQELGSAVDAASAWTHEFPHGIRFDRTVLVQEYVPGQEFSVEGVSDAGRFHAWGVTMKYTTSGSARAETGHVFPAPIDDALRDEVLRVAEEGVAALGITDGISHTEIKLDASGAPVLIESGPRPAGDFIPLLVERATGQSPIDVYVEQATSGLGRRFLPEMPERAAAIQFFRPTTAGTFAGLDLPETLTAAHIEDSRITAAVGAEVAPGTTNMDRVGWAVLEATTPQDAAAGLVELAERARVRIE